MKKKAITTVVLLLATLALGFFSIACKKKYPKDTCDGIDLSPRYYKIASYSRTYENLRREGVNNKALHLYDSILYRIKPGSTQQLSLKSAPEFQLISSAYACSPQPPQPIHSVGQLHVINKVKTTYLTADDTLFVGDTISSHFLLKRMDEKDFSTFEKVFSASNSKTYEDAFDLRLKDKPHQPTELSFDVVVKMTDGTLFRLQDNVLYVK